MPRFRLRALAVAAVIALGTSTAGAAAEEPTVEPTSLAAETAAAPTLTASGETLTWTEVPGASGYRLYYNVPATKEHGYEEVVGTSARPAGKPGATLKWKVRAELGVKSKWSNAVTVTYPAGETQAEKEAREKAEREAKEKEEREKEAAKCTTTLASGANLGTALNSAAAGSTICLAPGTYSATSWSEHGNATLTSASSTSPAKILGRFVTKGSATNITLSHLIFEDPTAEGVIIGTREVNFLHNDVSAPEGICMNLVEYSGAKAEKDHIEFNTVHNCGRNINHEFYKTCDITCQGIYTATSQSNVIANNWCWDAAARCYQVRSGDKNNWHNNTSDESREGFIFGDLTPTNDIVEHNIVGYTKDNSAYTYGSVGSGDVFANNCIGKPFGSNGGVATANNTVVAVQFADAAAHDYTLTSASVNTPCLADQATERPGP